MYTIKDCGPAVRRCMFIGDDTLEFAWPANRAMPVHKLFPCKMNLLSLHKRCPVWWSMYSAVHYLVMNITQGGLDIAASRRQSVRRTTCFLHVPLMILGSLEASADQRFLRWQRTGQSGDAWPFLLTSRAIAGLRGQHTRPSKCAGSMDCSRLVCGLFSDGPQFRETSISRIAAFRAVW